MTSSTNGELRSALGRVYLQSGQIDKADAHFAVVAADANVPEPTKALNAAFVASARGDWVTAGDVLRGLVEEDDANYAVRFHHSPSCLAWHMLLIEGCLLLLFSFVC